jgi:hypothetical protein
VELTAEKIYEALSNLVDFDPGQLFDADGKPSTHPSATTSHGSANPHFVIPSELRISYYAALINDHVCGFL